MTLYKEAKQILLLYAPKGFSKQCVISNSSGCVIATVKNDLAARLRETADIIHFQTHKDFGGANQRYSADVGAALEVLRERQ
jgi:hypothetical protein